MLYIKFQTSFFTTQRSGAAAAITAALGGDASWLPTSTEACVTIDVELTAALQLALDTDENVVSWETELSDCSFQLQYDCPLGSQNEWVHAQLPFWHFTNSGDLSPNSPIWGDGGPLGYGGASESSIEAAGGRVLGNNT